MAEEDWMKAETYLKLHPSEIAVVEAASRVFCAYISSGLVTAESEEEMILKAFRVAIRMAQATDGLVQSDEEIRSAV
jgi:hypothetical protein